MDSHDSYSPVQLWQPHSLSGFVIGYLFCQFRYIEDIQLIFLCDAYSFCFISAEAALECFKNGILTVSVYVVLRSDQMLSFC